MGLRRVFAHTVIADRWRVVVGFIVVAGMLGLGTARLTSDPRPQRLSGAVVDEAGASRLREHFHDPDDVSVVLVRADDVLSPPVLAYAHHLALGLRALPGVSRVDSLTLRSLPLGPGGTDEESSGEDLDDLDDLDDRVPTSGTPDAAVEASLASLVRSSPARFPLGMLTVADRVAGLHPGLAVEGDTVDAGERDALLAALARTPLADGRLVSRDRRVAPIYVYLDEEPDAPRALASAVESIDETVAAERAPRGVQVTIGGLPHLFHEVAVHIEEDRARIIPASLVLSLLVLSLAFRWLPGTALPLVSVGLTSVAMFGFLGWIGEPMNVLNNVLPPLLIILGVAEAIHVVERYREHLREHPPDLAARMTLERMALPSLLTTGTTAVGLASLVTSRTPMLRSFGLLAALGVMVTYVVTIVFLPAALSFFAGRRASPRARSQPRLERAVERVTRLASRRPWWALAATLLVVLGACSIASRVRVDSALLDELQRDDEAYRAAMIMDASLGGVRPLEIGLSVEEGTLSEPARLAGIDDAQRWLASQPDVRSTLGPGDYVRDAWARVTGDPAARDEPLTDPAQWSALMAVVSAGDPDSLGDVLSPDHRTARIEARMSDVGSRATLALVERARCQFEQRLAPLGIQVTFGGQAYTGSVGLDAIVHDLLSSLATAVVVIFAMLALLFRSLRLGLLSVPANVLPIVGALAWMAIRGIPLNAATMIVFSISLGIAVDASIHFLSRYREEARRGERNALRRTARGAGPAMVVSSMTLIVGFGVMMLSSFVPVRRFGELISVSILLSLVSTLLVLPALLRVSGPRRRQPGAS